MKQSISVTSFVAAAVFFGASMLALRAESPSQEQQNQLVAEIRTVIQAQQEAWNRGDIEGFMNGYARSDSTIFVSGDDVTRGWQTVHDRYKTKYSDREKMGMLTFSNLEIRPLGSDAAIVLGQWKLDRKQE